MVVHSLLSRNEAPIRGTSVIPRRLVRGKKQVNSDDLSKEIAEELQLPHDHVCSVVTLLVSKLVGQVMQDNVVQLRRLGSFYLALPNSPEPSHTLSFRVCQALERHTKSKWANLGPQEKDHGQARRRPGTKEHA